MGMSTKLVIAVMACAHLTGCAASGAQQTQPDPAPFDGRPIPYRVTLEATSVGGLGACTNAGEVGLVTPTGSDGGVSYELYYCKTKGGAWTAVVCNATASS